MGAVLRKLTIALLLVLTSCAGQVGTPDPETISVQRSAAAFVKKMDRQGGLLVTDKTELEVVFSSDGKYARFESKGITLFADLEKEMLLVPYAVVKDVLVNGKNNEDELAVVEAAAPLFDKGAMLEVSIQSKSPLENAGRQFARLLEIRSSTVSLLRILAADPSVLVKELSKESSGYSVSYGITMDMKAAFYYLDLEEDAYLRYVSNELSVYFDGKNMMSSGPSFSPPLYSTLSSHPLPEFWNGERVALDDLKSALSAG